MKDLFQKIAAKREEREKGLYGLEENWDIFGSVCPDHAGVRKRLVSNDKEKEDNGFKASDMVWQCPVDKKYYGPDKEDDGIAGQTKGFASEIQLRSNKEPIDESIKAAADLARELGYVSGKKSN